MLRIALTRTASREYWWHCVCLCARFTLWLTRGWCTGREGVKPNKTHTNIPYPYIYWVYPQAQAHRTCTLPTDYARIHFIRTYIRTRHDIIPYILHDWHNEKSSSPKGPNACASTRTKKVFTWNAKVTHTHTAGERCQREWRKVGRNARKCAIICSILKANNYTWGAPNPITNLHLYANGNGDACGCGNVLRGVLLLTPCADSNQIN